jgi:hypothetical protein
MPLVYVGGRVEPLASPTAVLRRPARGKAEYVHGFARAKWWSRRAWSRSPFRLAHGSACDGHFAQANWGASHRLKKASLIGISPRVILSGPLGRAGSTFRHSEMIWALHRVLELVTHLHLLSISRRMIASQYVSVSCRSAYSFICQSAKGTRALFRLP